MRRGWLLAIACAACGSTPKPRPAQAYQAPTAPFFAPGTDLRWLTLPKAPRPEVAHPEVTRDARCARDTSWDGIACARTRATCGAWDGDTCEPSRPALERERAFRLEFAQIDADARAVCPEDGGDGPIYSGTAAEVLKVVDAALSRAAAIDRRLENLRDRASSPNWSVATLGRAGSIYDCISTGLTNATPNYFTPQQQAKLNQLMLLVGPLNATRPGNQGSALQQSIQSTIQQVQQKWLDERDRYLDMLAAKVVVRYVTAALLARRYAIEGFAFTRAGERLPVVAAALGAARIKTILEAVPNPTDPTWHEPIQYFDGAFAP